MGFRAMETVVDRLIEGLAEASAELVEPGSYHAALGHELINGIPLACER
jgi:hypothetical protein